MYTSAPYRSSQLPAQYVCTVTASTPNRLDTPNATTAGDVSSCSNGITDLAMGPGLVTNQSINQR